MRDLITADKRLLALLKQDGSASIINIAATLNISRATVTSRIDRLIQSTAVQRFGLAWNVPSERRTPQIVINSRFRK